MQLVTSASPIIKAVGNTKTLIIDTETSSLYPHRDGKILAGIGVRPLWGEGFYLPFRHDNIVHPNAPLSELMRLYELFRGRTLIFHHAKFDLMVLWNEGLNLLQEDIVDTLVTVRLVLEDLGSYKLENLAFNPKVLNYAFAREPGTALRKMAKAMGWGYMDKEEEFQMQFNKIPAEVIYDPYVKYDLRFPDELYTRSMRLIKERGLEELLELEKKVTKTMFWMELRGFHMDEAYIASELKSLTESQDRFEEEVYKAAGKEFNQRSNKQLGEIFESFGVYSPKLTTGGKNKDKQKPAWDKDVLKKLKHPLAEKIIKYRTVKKYRDYYDNFQFFMCEHGVIHPSLQQAGARTGRCSCREPNLQNIPVFGGDINPVTGEKYSELEASLYGKVRDAFIARPGCFLFIPDYAQIELRIFADYADEKDQMKLFDLGLDIHAMVALSAFGSMPTKGTEEYKFRRVIGKNIGFGLRYGLGATGLGKRIDKTKNEAQGFKNRYFERFPKVRLFMDKVQQVCIERGYVKNRWGRRRYLPYDKSYIAVNFLVQGTAADLMKDALWRVDDALVGLMAQVLLTIHDELIVEIPYEEAEVAIPIIMREMEYRDKSKIRVPITCDPSWSPTSWGAKKSMSCDTCSGKRKLFSASEEDMLVWLYKNDMDKLDGITSKECKDCKGTGYDITKITRPV